MGKAGKVGGSKKTKLGKNRLDKYYHLAKEQGYRSRAAFKLIQLNRKYDLLSGCRALLDLCAAPGGWLQVAAKTMPLTSLILGVDLVPIKPIRGVKTLVHDITTQACRTALKKEAKGSKFDVVVHDGAPNVGGAWSNEAFTQSALVLDSLRLATEFLAPNGSFVTKVFRSKDYNALLYAFNQLFNKVESTKPTASRNTSAEIFVVCQGYKAPAKIDPRLLDPKHLFAEVGEAKKVMGPEALLREKIKQRRHREGYEDGLSTSHKAASALTFLVSGSPVEMLGQYTKLALDGPESWQVEGVENAKEVAEAVRSHVTTTAEVRALCADLQVLGRSEFKQLLRWRLKLKKALAAELPVDESEAGKGAGKGHLKVKDKEGAEQGKEGEEGDATAPADPEEALLAEMAAVKEKMESRLKRERKHRREMKKKAKIRVLQMANAQGIITDEQEGLFSLGAISGAKGDGSKMLSKVTEMAAPGERDLEVLEADSEEESESEASDLDSDEEALRYEAELEESLEESYADYLARRGKREEMVKEKRKRLGMDGELGDEDDGPSGSGDDADAGARSEEEEEKGGGLLVTLDEGRAGVAKTGAAVAAQWFGQELFADANVEDEYSEEEEEEEEAGASKAPAKKRARKEAEGEAEEEGGEEEAGGMLRDGGDAGKSGREAGVAAGKEGPGFEVVPLRRGGESSGSESEDEYDMLDDQGKAEVLAIAKKMLRRKDKESIVDAAYSRYATHDTNLPRWFEEDEQRHRRPILPVTKEEVAAEKERLRSIDTRPIKKVAEAKMRKRKRLQSKLTKAREKAEVIAGQEDVPMKSKMREIEKLYARANSTAKKGGKGGKGGKTRKGPKIDGRLKQELCSKKRAAKKAGGGRRKGGAAKGGKAGGPKGKGGKGGRK